MGGGSCIGALILGVSVFLCLLPGNNEVENTDPLQQWPLFIALGLLLFVKLDSFLDGLLDLFAFPLHRPLLSLALQLIPIK